jgi:hypothetical protein
MVFFIISEFMPNLGTTGSTSEEGLQSPSSPDTLSTTGSDWEGLLNDTFPTFTINLGLERLCGERAARGPQESNAEALFMQQILDESGCIEWFFLV